MEILLCGSKNECRNLEEKIKLQMHNVNIYICVNGESLHHKLKQSQLDMIFILFDGAEGMEATMTMRQQLPEVSLVWFSNEIGFAAQSYRLNVAYFHVKPITQQILEKALVRCKLA